MRIINAKINKILPKSVLALKKLVQTDSNHCFVTAFEEEK